MERFIEEGEKVFDIIGFWDHCRDIICGTGSASGSGTGDGSLPAPSVEQIERRQVFENSRLRFYLGVRIFYTFFENDLESISLVYSQMYWEVHQN